MVNDFGGLPRPAKVWTASIINEHIRSASLLANQSKKPEEMDFYLSCNWLKSNLMCYCYSLSCYTLEYGLYILHWRFSCWIHHQNLSKSYQLCLLASFYQDSTSLTPKCCVEYEDMVDNYSCNYHEETLNFHTIYKQVLHNGYRKVLATLI